MKHWRNGGHEGQQAEREVFERETPFTPLDRTFNAGDERFGLKGVILILAFDPEMAPGLEIKIETTQPGTAHIDHRIHLTSQVRQVQRVTITTRAGRLQQSLPGVAKGLQLTIECSPKGVHQQRAQVRGHPHGGRTIFTELRQAERAGGEPAGTESPSLHLGIQGAVQSSGGLEGELPRIRWEELTGEGVAPILIATAQQDLTQPQPHQPWSTETEISLHRQRLKTQGSLSAQPPVEPLPALLRRQGKFNSINRESFSHPAIGRRGSGHFQPSATPAQQHFTWKPVRTKRRLEVSLHHRANGGHGENASSPGQTLESTLPILGQTNRSGTGFTDRDPEVRSQRLERTTYTTGRTD